MSARKKEMTLRRWLFEHSPQSEALLRRFDEECTEAEAVQDLVGALVSIEEYWNQDRNDQAMFDACWHAVETARAALAKWGKP